MTAKKPAKKPAPGKPMATGADVRRGRGPAKGAPNAGRPPDWWLQQVRAGLYRKETIAQLNKVLGNSEHTAFAAVLRWADERVHGKAAQPITGEGGGPIQVQVLRFGETEIRF